MQGARRLTVRVTRYGRAAVDALRALLAEHKAADALAPVTVVVPTKVTGLALRRALAATGRGMVGVRVVVLGQLAELLAAATLAGSGRTPLTPALRREHVRLVLAAAPGRLRSVAGHGATERLVDRATAELRRATAAGDEHEVLAALDAGPPLAQTLATLHRALRGRLGPIHYDDQDLAMAAAQVLRSDPSAAREVGPVILYLPHALSPAETRLLHALADRDGVHVLLGATGDPEADTPTARLSAALTGTSADQPGATAPVPDAALSAPDADEEVRGVVREIAGLLRAAAPLERVAVLYGDPEPYATLVAEHLAAADLPANGPVVRTLGQTIPGRVLSELLALPEAGFSRQAALDWLGLAPLQSPDGLLPIERWTEVAELAGVGRGRDQWRRRLRAYADGLAARGRDDTAARSLLDFVETLFTELEGPAQRTWTGFAAWATALLDRYLGQPEAPRPWPDEDRKAEAVLRERIAALAVLDGAASGSGDVDLAAFRRALRAELDEPAGRIGQFGVGVYLGPLATAAALDFDHSFVLGMAEGAFPTRPSEQPLLPDALRQHLRTLLPHSPATAALETLQERGARERAALLAILASDARTTLCHPRANRREQRERSPSPWFLELAGRRAGRGRALLADELQFLDGWYRDIASASAGIEHAAEPATTAEWVARELIGWQRAGHEIPDAPLVAAEPALGQAIAVAHARASAIFTPWDGRVGPHPFLDGRLDSPQSATALGRYGTCPRQYLLGQVLGIREPEEREDPLALEGAQRGLLLHGILERFVRALLGEPLDDPDARRTLLRRLGDEALAEMAEQGITDALRWRLSSGLVRAWLDRWLDEQDALVAELGVAPVGAELAFGRPGDALGTVSVALPSGRHLGFRGRIDRLDAAADGGVALVIDYKSSSDERYRGIQADPVLAGRELQLAVYALAAEHTYPGAEIHARYWFLGPRKGKAPHLGYVFDQPRRERALAVLDTLAEGIGAGAFPPRPGKWDDYDRTYEHCRSCAFDRVCPAPPERERAWERASGAPELARYDALVNGGAT